MVIAGIDPGAVQSGIVIWDTVKAEIVVKAILDNEAVINTVTGYNIDCVAIERIRGFGIVAGDSLFDTCEWVGRFHATITTYHGIPCQLIPRKDIKRVICGNTTTNDKYIREALLGKLGKDRCKGLKGHMWAALAVAITCEVMQT
jgi:hypothetical protein